jgi:hypothetical protein
MPRVKRQGYFYVIVEIGNDWLYVSDGRYTALDYTRYANLARTFSSRASARLEVLRQRLMGKNARTTQGYVK